jgi:hypothetical protein
MTAHTGNGRRRTTIASLPVELLVVIFRDVYKQGKASGVNLFAVTAVCSFWRDAATMVPEFWTRVKILIDLPHFSISFVASLLARSRDLVIEKAVVTRSIWTETNDECERTRVMSIMQAIAPHIRRCRAITFEVRFSSSLPSFPRDFRGTAERLESLELLCAEDDGGAPSNVGEMSR